MPIHRNASLLPIVIVLALLLSSCNYPGLQPSEELLATAAAATVSALLTESATEAPASAVPPTPTGTPEPSPPAVTPTGEPPTPTPHNDTPCDQALFITDVTVPDGTLLEPGETFTKTWRLQNTGTCTWTSGYALIFDGGDSMGGPAVTQLTGGTVEPGHTVDVSVELTAPVNPGTYQGFWRLRNSAGVSFGITNAVSGDFYVLVEVAEPTPTPYPVAAAGHLSVRQTWSADLDSGLNDSPPAGSADFWFEAEAPAVKFLSPANGALFHLWLSPGIPSREDCASSSLHDWRINSAHLQPGAWVCYRTNLGNYGRMEIEALTSDNPQMLMIDFITWDMH